ncbi:MAG TPA: hypothetical protein VF253_01735 [Candidatus Limnocylindrales bacterium]
MTPGPDRIPAIGGTRLIPAPDPIAAEYLLLGLRVGQHLPDLIDGYYGPADLKARADMEQLRPPRRLLDDIASLSERVRVEVDDDDRRDWLTAQLGALDAHVLALAGEPLRYLDYVERCMGFPPRRHADGEFDAAASEVDTLLPGSGSLVERLEAFDRQLEIPVDRIAAVAEWLLERFRDRAASLFGLPEGEEVRVALVRERPWIAYDWYLGALRSRVELNVDLPVTALDLIVTLGHEAYPGHHLEAAWHETDLVERLGRLEASMILTSTPEGPVSEGLARYGTRFASPPDERAALIAECMQVAAGPGAADAGAIQEIAEIAEVAVRLAPERDRLEGATDEAAIRLHADGASREDVLGYLRAVGRYRPDVAAKRLAFIDDPLSRLYVFAYEGGEALVTSWVETAETPDQVGRFGRLLHEQVTPGRLLVERA